MKIFITGCAKSGTTLLRRLFNAFELNVCNQKEISLDEFILSNYDVGKRTVNTIFSGVCNAEGQYETILAHNVKIINIEREKTRTLKSGYVDENRYNLCASHRETFGDIISHTIKYEDLVARPDEIQAEVAQIFDLKINHLWSEYPSFVNPETDHNLKESPLEKITLK